MHNSKDSFERKKVVFGSHYLRYIGVVKTRFSFLAYKYLRWVLVRAFASVGAIAL